MEGQGPQCAKMDVPSPVWRALLWSVLVCDVVQNLIRQWPNLASSFWRGLGITSACCLTLWAWSHLRGCRTSFWTDARARRVFCFVVLLLLLPVLLRRLSMP